MILWAANFKTQREANFKMNMQETIRYTVTPDDCDSQGFLDICRLADKAAAAASTRNRLEGAGRQVLMEKLHAVWMIRRIKLRQYRHAHVGDEIVGYGSGRTLCGNQYAQYGELYINGELLADTNVMIMPVVLKSRRRLRCKNIEPLFTTPALNEAPAFDILPTLEEVEYSHERSFTPDDCDNNAAHLSFFRYPALMRELLPIGKDEHPLIAKLQLDYIRECVDGSRIVMGCVPNGKGYTVQAKHKNGKPCFNAYVEFDKQ